MSNEMTIAAPDRQQFGVIQPLPEWLTSRLALALLESRKNPSGYPTQVMVLPEAALLNTAERHAVSGHLAALGPLLASTPTTNRESAKQTLALITKMMLALPSRKTGEVGADATGEAYMIALDDVPSWGVAAAMRRWYRGECGPQHDCSWRPSPADLRALSLSSAAVIKWRSMQLDRLLTAEAKTEFSDSHCAAMREKIARADVLSPPLAMSDRGLSGSTHDGKHAQRVMADLASKRACRESVSG